MDIVSALLLGVVQGLTEFLPISSTGHLILFRSILGVADEYALAFDATLHLATATAVVLYFHRDLRGMLQTFLRLIGRLPVNERDVVLMKALIVGTVPAVVVGLVLEDLMESTFRHPLLVAAILVVGSILFMIAEFHYREDKKSTFVTTGIGFKIGLFQTLALIPGMSRSGATIAGGMLLGLTRFEAARFAFLLAIPVMLGAGAKKLIELMEVGGAVPWVSVLVGALAAFTTGLLAIHFMLSFVRSHSLWPFIWYRIILAGVVVFVVFFS